MRGDPLGLRPSAVRVGLDDPIFSPLRFRNLEVVEPGLPLEHLRPVRRLRRLGHADADQLGAALRARRRGRDHLGVVRRRPARPDRPRLRVDRERRRGSRSGASSASACTSTAASTSSSSPTAAASATSSGIEFATGLSSTGKRDPLHGFPAERATAARAAATSWTRSRDGGAPRARGGPRRGRAPRRERLPVHAVPLVRDQRPQGRVRRPAREPRAPAPRGRAGRPRRASATTSTSR